MIVLVFSVFGFRYVSCLPHCSILFLATRRRPTGRGCRRITSASSSPCSEPTSPSFTTSSTANRSEKIDLTWSYLLHCTLNKVCTIINIGLSKLSGLDGLFELTQHPSSSALSKQPILCVSDCELMRFLAFFCIGLA